MKKNKWIAITMTAALTAAMIMSPGAGLQAQASSGGKVYVDNQTKDMSMVSISTPLTSTILYTGITWEQLEDGVGVRLNVSTSECGTDARKAFTAQAAAVKGTIVKYLNMDLEEYLDGWTNNVTSTFAPLRIAMSLPAGSSTALDYAVVAMKSDGSMEVLGDLDANPSTVTVDCSDFQTFAIVSGAKGAFDAYKTADPNAMKTVSASDYVKTIGTTIGTATNCAYLYATGVKTDAGTVHSLVGSLANLTISDSVPGAAARSSLQDAIKKSGARRFSFVAATMKNGNSAPVISTASPIRVTMTAPYNYPAYGDYAVAVLNADGTTTVYKDIDANSSTITIDTTQFRDYAILWGTPGTFDAK